MSVHKSHIDDLIKQNEAAWTNSMRNLAKAKPEFEADIIHDIEYINYGRKLLEKAKGIDGTYQHRRWDIKAA